MRMTEAMVARASAAADQQPLINRLSEDRPPKKIESSSSSHPAIGPGRPYDAMDDAGITGIGSR